MYGWSSSLSSLSLSLPPFSAPRGGRGAVTWFVVSGGGKSRSLPRYVAVTAPCSCMLYFFLAPIESLASSLLSAMYKQPEVFDLGCLKVASWYVWLLWFVDFCSSSQHKVDDCSCGENRKQVQAFGECTGGRAMTRGWEPAARWLAGMVDSSWCLVLSLQTGEGRERECVCGFYATMYGPVCLCGC